MASTGSNSSAPSTDDAAAADADRRRADANQAARRSARSSGPRARRSPASLPACAGRIIIVDASSTDGTPAQARSGARRRSRLSDRARPTASRRELPAAVSRRSRARSRLRKLSRGRARARRARRRRDRRGPLRSTPAWIASLARPLRRRHVRLRLAPLPPPSVRRRDHQEHRLSGVQGAVRRAASSSRPPASSAVRGVCWSTS